MSIMNIFLGNEKIDLRIVNGERRYYLSRKDNEKQYIKKIESDFEFKKWEKFMKTGYGGLPGSIKSTLDIDYDKFKNDSMIIACIFEEQDTSGLNDEIKITLSFKRYTSKNYIEEKEEGFALTDQQKEEIEIFLKKVEGKDNFFHELTRFHAKNKRGGAKIPLLVGFLYYLTTETKKYFLNGLMSVTNSKHAKKYKDIFEESIDENNKLSYVNEIEVDNKIEKIELYFSHFKYFYKNKRITQYFNEFEIVTSDYYTNQFENRESYAAYLPIEKDTKNPDKYIFKNGFILEKENNSKIIVYRKQGETRVILLSLEVEPNYNLDTIKNQEIRNLITRNFQSIIKLNTVFNNEVDSKILQICIVQAIKILKMFEINKNITLITSNEHFKLVSKVLNIENHSEPLQIEGKDIVLSFLKLEDMLKLQITKIRENIQKAA